MSDGCFSGLQLFSKALRGCQPSAKPGPNIAGVTGPVDSPNCIDERFGSFDCLFHVIWQW
jgi:hypothetical protein